MPGGEPAGGEVPAEFAGWSLAWAEEFDGQAGSPADPGTWRPETGGHGWGNAELQYYTRETANAALDGAGSLAITVARPDPRLAAARYDGCQYTSARLVTKGLRSFRYGLIQARIKLPPGRGIWPACWMLGTDIDASGWPGCGEIDVMENFGTSPAMVHGTVHGPGYYGGDGITAALDAGGPLSAAFHAYSVCWEPGRIRWYADQTLYHTVTPATVRRPPLGLRPRLLPAHQRCRRRPPVRASRPVDHLPPVHADRLHPRIHGIGPAGVPAAAVRLAREAGDRAARPGRRCCDRTVVSAAHKAAGYAAAHEATIAGAAAGLAVFAGCEAVTAGAGTVGCAALSGAAAGAATYEVNSAQHGGFSWSGLGSATATGAVAGLAGGMLGEALGTAAGALGDGALGDAAEAVAGSCSRIGGQSFSPATKVLLASGVAVPISQLHIGNKVLATNTKTGKTQAEAVTAVLVHHDTNLYDLTVKDGSSRTAVIHTTANHLFWVPRIRGHGGRWVKAAALKLGTHLRTPSGSDNATVLSGRVPRQSTGWMWDLTVPGDNDHDFYVLATGPFRTTAPAVLVHNVTVIPCSSYTAARRAAFRDNNVPTSQANNYSVDVTSGDSFTPNMRGPHGELPQSIYTQDLNGNPVEIQDHAWGHVFNDTGEVMGPHLKGPDPDNVHYFYPK